MIKSMRPVFIDFGKLSCSNANMRDAKKAPDVSDILPTVRARGVLVPLIVRPNCGPDAFEIVAGARRFTAAQIVATETGTADPLPCAILEDRSEEHTSELQSLMRTSYAVFCLKKQKHTTPNESIPRLTD